GEEEMSRFTRRDLIKAGVAAGALAGAPAIIASRARAEGKFTPEKGASIRLLRWKRFVQGDEDMWMKNTEKFSKETGVKVRVGNEGWEAVRPKAAVAANIGSGPDVILGWLDDPHQFPDKLHDIGDVAGYLGEKYGGWHETARRYGTARVGGKEKWVGLP